MAEYFQSWQEKKHTNKTLVNIFLRRIVDPINLIFEFSKIALVTECQNNMKGDIASAVA